MSKYSGRCDFYDFLSINAGKKGTVHDYKGNIIIEKDYSKYYGYIVGVAASDQASFEITLSRISCPDERERDYFRGVLRTACDIFKKYKSKLDHRTLLLSVADSIKIIHRINEPELLVNITKQAENCSINDDNSLEKAIDNIINAGYRYWGSEAYRKLLREDFPEND